MTDLLPIDATRVALVVGDVVGHGAAAAAVMGQLRSALAAYLLDGHSPAAALERLDRFARRVPGASGSTCVCLVLDCTTGELTWARAGHPPVLLLEPAGPRYLDDGGGTVLGVTGRPPYPEARAVIEPGSSVLLYTDGLVERRGEVVDEGQERLARAAAAIRDLAPDAVVAALIDAALGDTAQPDDVALVAVRLVPEPLQGRLPARPRQLRVMRRAVEEWAAAVGLPDDVLDDLQYALGEAAANAVEHAYGGLEEGGEFSFTLTHLPGVDGGDGGVAVEVSDQGRWWPVPADSGYRGRGVQVLHAIGRDVRIDSGDGGTTVRFRVPVPRFPAPARRRTAPPAGTPNRQPGRRPRSPRWPVSTRPSSAIAGDLDLAGVTAVRPALLAALRPGELVVDLCDTGYVSSAGVALLMELTTAARHRETVLAVRVAPGSPLARVLDLTGLEAVLPVVVPRLARTCGQASGDRCVAMRASTSARTCSGGGRRVDDLRPDPRRRREEPLPHRLQPLGAELALACERHLARQVEHEDEVRARGEVGEHPEVGTFEPPQRAGDRQQGVVGVAVEDHEVAPGGVHGGAQDPRPHAERPDDDREHGVEAGVPGPVGPLPHAHVDRPHRHGEAAARPATSVDSPTPSGPSRATVSPRRRRRTARARVAGPEGVRTAATYPLDIFRSDAAGTNGGAMTHAAGTVAVTLPTETSVLLTRAFAAPPQLLYRACTEPDLVRRWWSGGTGEVAVADIDLRVGGRWRFVTAGDGYEVGSHGVYRELVPGARIVCTEVYEGHPDGEAGAALCTYTFRGAPGHTAVALLTAMRTREDRDALLESGMDEGVHASWGLLDAGRAGAALTGVAWFTQVGPVRDPLGSESPACATGPVSRAGACGAERCSDAPAPDASGATPTSSAGPRRGCARTPREPGRPASPVTRTRSRSPRSSTSSPPRYRTWTPRSAATSWRRAGRCSERDDRTRRTTCSPDPTGKRRPGRAAAAAVEGGRPATAGGPGAR